MTELSRCQFYCLSNCMKKTENMISKFKNLDINCKFYCGTINNYDKIYSRKFNKHKKRQLSMTNSHLNIFKDFYHNKNSKYAIICEDDIIMHKEIKNILNKVIMDFTVLDLDILLLGYMLPYKISNYNSSLYNLIADMPTDSEFKYYNYPYFLSGTQMYIISKNYAKYILDKHYIMNYRNVTNFTIDKVLIHDGNRALIYPMLAMENSEQKDPYHKLCHKIHYNENYI